MRFAGTEIEANRRTRKYHLKKCVDCLQRETKSRATSLRSQVRPDGDFVRFPGIAQASFFALLVSSFSLRGNAQDDVSAIIQKSVAANDRDWDADPEFDYYETDRDASGTKTYQVTTQYGTPYERLVAISGKQLSMSQKQQEERKFEKAMTQRRAESPREKAARIAKFKAERRRDHAMLAQLTKAFDFASQGEQQLGQFRVYVLKATPHPGYRPPDRDSRVLTGMEGTLWIDKNTYQWVKVEAHVMHSVSIAGSVAKVEPGTRFELEKAPVEGDIWLSKHFTMTASAKVLYLVSKHSQEDDTFFNYHRRQPQGSEHSQSSNGFGQSAP